MKNAILQINTTGAWRNVVSFPPEREAEVVAALAPLAAVLRQAQWCILRENNTRHWVKPDAAGGVK